MRVSETGDREGILTQAVNWPVELLYCSISWSSLVTPSEAVKRISAPSGLAGIWKFGSAPGARGGEVGKAGDPAPRAGSIWVGLGFLHVPPRPDQGMGILGTKWG